MIVVPFMPEHAKAIKLQSSQVRDISYLEVSYIESLYSLGPAVTGEEHGKIIACGGVANLGHGNGFAWAMMAVDSGPRFVMLDRVMRRMLQSIDLRRIEATVAVDFPQGVRWLELLGFQSEGTMRKYGLSGEDHFRYSRIN